MNGITNTRPRARKSQFQVTLVTVVGATVTDTVAAYTAEDAGNLARSMMRANHGETGVTVTAVQEVTR